jgi:WD40 repeat protein
VTAWAAGRGQTVRLWAAEELRLITEGMGHSGNIRGVFFSPDERQVALAPCPVIVCIYLLALQIPFSSVSLSVSFSQVVTVGEDSCIFIWNIYA